MRVKWLKLTAVQLWSPDSRIRVTVLQFIVIGSAFEGEVAATLGLIIKSIVAMKQILWKTKMTIFFYAKEN